MKMSEGFWNMIFRLVVLCFLMEDVINCTAQQDVCRTLAFIPPIAGHALVNHVIRNITLDRQHTCQVECYLDNHCLSFNFGHNQDGEPICELSDSDHRQHPEDLWIRERFTYVGTENDCSSNPCSRNGKCEIDAKDNKYRCQCKPGYDGRNCEIDLWEKLNNKPVCFGARDDSFGVFRVKKDGGIVTFKLVHRSGYLRCRKPHTYPGTHWGCINPYSTTRDNDLLTVITFTNKTALPIAEYGNYGSTGCAQYFYGLKGFNNNSSQLVFNQLPVPLPVSRGQKFQIWYGHDLVDCTEKNNGGQTCADVYAWYN